MIPTIINSAFRSYEMFGWWVDICLILKFYQEYTGSVICGAFYSFIPNYVTILFWGAPTRFAPSSPWPPKSCDQH